MTDREAKPKKTRRRGPNVTAGCVTCKIRRKKCDQTHPACLRCTSTGRTCDFLASPGPKALNGTPECQGSQPSAGSKVIDSKERKKQYRFKYVFVTEHPKSLPSFATLSDPIEAQHFDFFRTVCTSSFSTHFNANLWKGIILRAAHTEPFVLHAVLAIGALTRFNTHAPLYTVPILEYSLKKYSLASRMLGQRMKSGTADWKLAVLGSLIFLAIEVLQGHEMGALLHMWSGEAILRSLPSGKPDIYNTLSTSSVKDATNVAIDCGDSEDLVTAYTRLSIDEYPFLGLCGSSNSEPEVPLSFKNIKDARSILNAIIAAAYSFYRRHGSVKLKILPMEALPTKVATELRDMQTLLQAWRQALDRLIAEQKNSDEATSLGIKNVMIAYLVAFIRTSTFFYKDQLIYDYYLPHFEEPLDLTAIVVLDNHNSSNTTGGKGPCYTLDVAMAQPLFFVACRCRDPNLRRKAICVMKLVGKYGIYTGRAVAKVAEWVVAAEEGKNTDGFAREERRFHDVSFDFNIKTKVGTVCATKMNGEGKLEQVIKLLDLR